MFSDRSLLFSSFMYEYLAFLQNPEVSSLYYLVNIYIVYESSIIIHLYVNYEENEVLESRRYYAN